METLSFEQMEGVQGGKAQAQDCLSEGLYLAGAVGGLAAAIATGGWGIGIAAICLCAAEKAFYDCVS